MQSSVRLLSAAIPLHNNSLTRRVPPVGQNVIWSMFIMMVLFEIMFAVAKVMISILFASLFAATFS